MALSAKILSMTVYSNNSRALFNFEILERFTAGLELLGMEVKSIRTGKMNLRGAFVAIRPSTRSGQAGGAFLIAAEIPAYQPKNAPKDYDPLRPKKLLLAKDEIVKLEKAESTKGLTIVPISVYSRGRFLKLDMAIVRGKKMFDKRQQIKKRDVERDLKRTL